MATIVAPGSGLSFVVTRPRIDEVVTCADATATTRSSATLKSSRFMFDEFRDTIYVSGWKLGNAFRIFAVQIYKKFLIQIIMLNIFFDV